MKGLLADINVAGQVREILVQHFQSDRWREIWESLQLQVFSFADLGLAADASDSMVWQLCQAQELILITGNRNADSPDSLESTIRVQNTAKSLPVITFADSEHVRNSKPYRERVAARLLEYLLDIDQVRGTGRLYVP